QARHQAVSPASCPIPGKIVRTSISRAASICPLEPARGQPGATILLLSSRSSAHAELTVGPARPDANFCDPTEKEFDMAEAWMTLDAATKALAATADRAALLMRDESDRSRIEASRAWDQIELMRSDILEARRETQKTRAPARRAR